VHFSEFLVLGEIGNANNIRDSYLCFLSSFLAVVLLSPFINLRLEPAVLDQL
jgi:hypothetical protein